MVLKLTSSLPTFVFHHIAEQSCCVGVSHVTACVGFCMKIHLEGQREAVGPVGKVGFLVLCVRVCGGTPADEYEWRTGGS